MPKRFFRRRKSGFTLLGTLLCVALVIILTIGIVIYINPAKHFAESRNTTRLSDLEKIASAVYQYSLDHNGAFPPNIDYSTRMIGTSASDCTSTCTSQVTTSGNTSIIQTGTFSNTIFNTSTTNLELTNSGKIAGTGDFLSNIIDAGAVIKWNKLGWVPTSPYYKELPNGKTIETAYASGNSNMTGNVLLLHLNESSGQITDSSGSGNNGSSTNVTYGTAGKLNTAISFNGTTSHIEINNNPTLQLSTALTIEAWVKANTNKSSKIFQKGDWDGFSIYQDLWNGWCASIAMQDGNNSSIVWGNGRPVLNKWYHLAATYDGTAFRLYVNGTLANSTPLTGQIRSTNRKVSLGSDAGSQKFFGGEIDEAALYNRALTSSEISDHYKRASERLKFQIRSCDDALCAGESLFGPDGTGSSYYSELNNTTLGLPSFNMINIPDNRYFQFKATLESDNPSTTPSLASVSITNTNGDLSMPGSTGPACVDLQTYLVPNYLVDIPFDTQTGNSLITNYAIKKLSGRRIEVSSCTSELGQIIIVKK